MHNRRQCRQGDCHALVRLVVAETMQPTALRRKMATPKSTRPSRTTIACRPTSVLSISGVCRHVPQGGVHCAVSCVCAVVNGAAFRVRPRTRADAHVACIRSPVASAAYHLTTSLHLTIPPSYPHAHHPIPSHMLISHCAVLSC